MSTSPGQLSQVVTTAVASGILPPGTEPPPDTTRPWPVTLLTALGAWLAAVPLMAVVGLLLGDLISKSGGPYAIGILLLALAITVLRARRVSVFVEQLAVPALLVGGAALAFGLFRDVPTNGAAACLAVLALAIAFAIPQAWLRVLLGAAAAAFWVLALLPGSWFESDQPEAMIRVWLALHAALLLWVLASLVQSRVLAQGSRARFAAVIESVNEGWLLTLLAGLCAWSGMAFLVGGSLGGGFWGDMATGTSDAMLTGNSGLFVKVCSVLLAVGAGLYTARAWPTLRQPAIAAAALVLTILCWFLPALGAVLIALAVAACSKRWLLATAAGFAAVWIVSSFYYQLSWSLADKAALLVLLGIALGMAAWWGSRAGHGVPPAATPADVADVAAARSIHSQRSAAWVAMGTVVTLLLVNYSIWQKENLIAHGLKVLVELAPLDPRSLMQGDFMRLNYRLPDTVEPELQSALAGKQQQRPFVIARRDARGVAQLLRLGQFDTPLAAGEMRIELTPKNGDWTLVSDAWFFREGDAKRWEAARYGEFRVTPSGQALLVGMADAQLKSIPIAP